MAIVQGVDVSNHQPPDRCNWTEALETGVSFAWVKVTEGRDFTDPASAQHLQRIQVMAPDMLRGGYHFARPDNRFKESDNGRHNGQTEAAWAAAMALRQGALGRGCLPFALDLEKYTEQGKVTTAQRDDFARGIIDERPCQHTHGSQLIGGPVHKDYLCGFFRANYFRQQAFIPVGESAPGQSLFNGRIDDKSNHGSKQRRQQQN